MPIITLTISPQETDRKRALAERLTDVAAEITQIDRERFVVIIDEHPRDSIGVGGTLLCDAKPQS